MGGTTVSVFSLHSSAYTSKMIGRHLLQSSCARKGWDFEATTTVVPPIYDPSDQRPPLVYDRFCYGRTKFVLQLPLVSDHLSNATSDR